MDTKLLELIVCPVTKGPLEFDKEKQELISRSALITLMYQSDSAATHSHEEHTEIVKALADQDEELAVRLMDEHLSHVEANLVFDKKPWRNDLSLALSNLTG